MDDSVELSLDSEEEYEVTEYRTSFDADGYPERETPIPESRPRSNAITSDGQMTLRLIWERLNLRDEAIKSLEKSNAELLARADREWKRQWMFTAAAVLLVVLFGAAGSAWMNHITRRDLDSKANQLLAEVGDNRRQIEQARESGEDTQAAFQAMERKAQRQFEKYRLQLENHSRSLQEQQRRSHDMSLAVYAATIDVNLGYQQLVHLKNPKQAKLCAQRAIDRLDEFQAKLNRQKVETTPASRTLAASYQSAWNLAARSSLELGDVDLVLKYGSQLVRNDSSSSVGYEYEGLALLYQTLGGDLQDKRRSELRQGAMQKLQTALGQESERNEVLLVLAAAHFDGNEFRIAADRARQFLQSFPPTPFERARLASRTEASVALATVWYELAESATGRDVTLDATDLSCAIAKADFHLVEARIYEEILDGVVKTPGRYGFAGRRAKEAAAYCLKIAEAIRTGSCPAVTATSTAVSRVAKYRCTSPDCDTPGRRLIVNNRTDSNQKLNVNGVVHDVAPGQRVFMISNRDAVIAHLVSEPSRSWSDWRQRQDQNGEEIVIGIGVLPLKMR